MQGNSQKQNVAAIIVAAGSGLRIGGDIKKQFVSIHGKSVLQHTLEKFQKADTIHEIIVVGPATEWEHLEDVIRDQWKIEKLSFVVPGGSERYDSVLNGIKSVTKDIDFIAIHDGVRPCISIHKIDSVVNAAIEHGAAILAVMPKDTIKVKDSGYVIETLNRESLVLVQTPQVFNRHLLQKAYDYAYTEKKFGTDDASLVEQIGEKVFLVNGDYTNIKITSPEDLIIAEKFLE